VRPSDKDRQKFEAVLNAVQSNLLAASSQIVNDDFVRAQYGQELKRGISDIRMRFESGKFASIETASEAAHEFRNNTLNALRLRSSPVGLQVAKNLKSEGPTFNTIVAKYTKRLYGESADFNLLEAEKQGKIYAEIIESASKDNADITRWLRLSAPYAKKIMYLSIAISVYDIATADDKVATAKVEGGSLAASIAGGAAGGAVAGLFCGPGAPVCVTVGAFVGGALGAFGFQLWVHH
jgi:hypothetical protein